MATLPYICYTIQLFYTLLFLQKMEKSGTIFPHIRLAYLCSTVTFTCYSNTPPIWWKDGLQINSAHPHLRRSIILRNVSISDSGTYYCMGKKAKNQLFTASANLTVGSKFSLDHPFYHRSNMKLTYNYTCFR